MRISDWSSDVCSSDLTEHLRAVGMQAQQRTAYVQAQGDQGQRQPVARARECLLCGTQAMVVYGEGGPSVAQLRLPQQRSAERRVGKECVSSCRSRLSSFS